MGRTDSSITHLSGDYARYRFGSCCILYQISFLASTGRYYNCFNSRAYIRQFQIAFDTSAMISENFSKILWSHTRHGTVGTNTDKQVKHRSAVDPGRWNIGCSDFPFYRPSSLARFMVLDSVYNNRRRCQLSVFKRHLQILEKREDSNTDVPVKLNCILISKTRMSHIKESISTIEKVYNIFWICTIVNEVDNMWFDKSWQVNFIDNESWRFLIYYIFRTLIFLKREYSSRYSER